MPFVVSAVVTGVSAVAVGVEPCREQASVDAGGVAPKPCGQGVCLPNARNYSSCRVGAYASSFVWHLEPDAVFPSSAVACHKHFLGLSWLGLGFVDAGVVDFYFCLWAYRLKGVGQLPKRGYFFLCRRVVSGHHVVAFVLHTVHLQVVSHFVHGGLEKRNPVFQAVFAVPDYGAQFAGRRSGCTAKHYGFAVKRDARQC